MAQPFTTGPGHIYCSVAAPAGVTSPPGRPLGTGTPAYLGVCETTPKIRIQKRFSPIMSDIGGDSVPHANIYSGKSGMVFGDLTVYNWPVLLRVMSCPNFSGAGLPPFDFLTDERGSIGAIMEYEGFAFHTWIQFPYSRKPAYAGLGMIPGIHFYMTWLFSPDEFDMGTKPNKIHIQIYASRAYNPATGDWQLGDTNMTGIPANPPSSAAGV